MGGYQSVYDIYSISMWLIGLVAAFLVVRTGRDIYAAMSDEDLGLKGAIKKVKKRIAAAVVAVTIEDALLRVNLLKTIREKGGLAMQLEERAANLSGGQKQRLVLARALLHDSDIYIFDEATSNIDVESENRIMEVVRGLAREKTVLLISHRLANVTAADEIFVLQAGTEGIAEHGTHQELMQRQGYYCRLYEAQQELESYAGTQQKEVTV